jgi:hypothetical protein
MLKFLKTTVAEDAITTEEVLVVVLAEDVQVAKEVQLQEEKEVLLQDVKVLVADLEATETQLHVKVVLDQEVLQLQELAVSLIEALDQQMLQDVTVVLLKDQQDVLKALVRLQEKEDQEEVKKDCRLQILDCRF